MELVRINGLSLSFATGGVENDVLKSVDVEINQGDIVGIVGESGSGKSTLAHAVMRLLPENITQYKSGEIIFAGKNIMQLNKKELMQVRGNDIGMIFQEPMTSLNPLHTIYKQIEEVLLLHGMESKKVKSRVIELLEMVRLEKLTERLKTYPHELSGGQRQRIMIAMALANSPKLLIADEPTTALDVNIQSQILDLLKDLNKKLGMSILLISHDLHMVKSISNKIYVMHEGTIIEHGATQNIFDNPQEEYTKYLLHCHPKDILVPYNQLANITLNIENMNVKFLLKSAILRRNRKYIHAVNDISIELRQGQTLGIVGESGSGKTTLVNAILRLIKSEGKININGHDIKNMKAKKLRSLRKNIQIVFQDPF
jgi:microcin C transport system ATP-binding protein